MPTYTFYNTETDEQFEDFMSWSQRETYLEENPHIEPMLTTAALVGDHIIQKVDGGMKDVFSRVAEAHPNSPLAKRYGRRSVKDTQIEKVRKKHRTRLIKGGGR